MSTEDTPAQANPILRLTGINKRFAGVNALQNVDFSINPGEVVALIGENGAGKSTLMKVIGGVHQPDSGKIYINGKEHVFADVSDSIKCGIGFIHQELNILDNMDIAANVYLGREPLYGGPLRLVNRRMMVTSTQVHINRLGLTVPADTPVERLSIAQRQLVEIAKALSLHAKIVIMDEPTSSLTIAETERLLDVIRQLRDEGVAVIYISHRLGEVREIADRVVGLRDGKNAGTLSKEEITHDNMVRMMVGRDIEKSNWEVKESQDPPALVIENLRTKRYPKSQINLSVQKGEILGVAGLIGAGRTEVAQAVFGVVPALSGKITLNGKLLKIRNNRQAIDQGIYLIPEDRRKYGLIVEMSIKDNITLPSIKRYAAAGLVNRGRERSDAEKASRALNVKTPSVDFIAKNLSGGNQQKVILAKWLSLSPKLVILDEPTRGIDIGAKAEIYELMRKLAAEGVPIIMISSDLEEVLNQSDRIAVMHEGRLTGILKRPEFSEEAVMHLAVGGNGGALSH